MNCSTATQNLESLQQLRTELGSVLVALKESQASGDTTQTEELKTKARAIKIKLETGIKELSRNSNDLEYLEEEVFKGNFLGPKQIEEVFNMDIDPADIPEIPYTPEQMEKGREDKCMLILFVPLTAQAVYERTKAKYENNPKNGKLLNAIDDPNCWYTRDKCFTTEKPPKMQWKLVPIETLPDSIDKTYAMQTKLLRDHLLSIGHITPEEENECTDQKLTELDNRAKTNKWKDAAESLVNLKINQNHRLSLSEELQRMTLSFLSKNIRVNEHINSWTKSISSVGDNLVYVGGGAPRGARVGYWLPERHYGDLGLSFSR